MIAAGCGRHAASRSREPRAYEGRGLLAGEAAVEGGVPGHLPLLASHPRWLFATTLPACSLSLYTLAQHSSLSVARFLANAG
jgi:hypothetical protein